MQMWEETATLFLQLEISFKTEKASAESDFIVLIENKYNVYSF